jgi:amidase
VIAWNEENAAQALPKREFSSLGTRGFCSDLSVVPAFDTQTELIKCRDGTMTEEKHDVAVSALRQLARNGSMAKYMHEHDLDIVLSSSDATLISFSACAGWPIATVPVGNLTENDQPWGMFALARDGCVHTLLRFMKAFRGSFPDVRAPNTPFE